MRFKPVAKTVLNLGRSEHIVYTTDFTQDYVKLNMGDGTGG